MDPCAVSEPNQSSSIRYVPPTIPAQIVKEAER